MYLTNFAIVWKISSFSSRCFFQEPVPLTNTGLHVGLSVILLFLPLVAHRTHAAGP